MEIITTPAAPAAIGPYSQAIKSCHFLFCSGQLGVDPANGALVSEDCAGQTRQALKNIAAILAAETLGFVDVVKTTIFLTSMDDFASVNEIYAEIFGQHKPARSTVAVAELPRQAKVEIECIAELS
ncbi:MAG TPA: RidA family protein [Chitinivibrionales bacterium]